MYQGPVDEVRGVLHLAAIGREVGVVPQVGQPWTPGTWRWAHRRSPPPATRCPGSTLNTGLMSLTRPTGVRRVTVVHRPVTMLLPPSSSSVPARSRRRAAPVASRAWLARVRAFALLRSSVGGSKWCAATPAVVHAECRAACVCCSTSPPWPPPPDSAASASNVNGSVLLLPAPLAPPDCMARGAPTRARQCRAVRRPGHPPHHAAQLSGVRAEARSPAHQPSSTSPTHAA